MRAIKPEQSCPCGAGESFGRCCGPAIAGDQKASTAEALMRSRYVAYVLGDAGYILGSWHRSTRPGSIDTASGPEWRSLEIRAADEETAPDRAMVEFVARYVVDGRPGALHETCRFVREQGEWFYLDGEVHPEPGTGGKVGRNAPCPCGSGRKYKRCCGA